MRVPWTQTRLWKDVHLLPKLHDFTRVALKQVHVGEALQRGNTFSPIKQIDLFPDGSHSDEGTGWGVVVMALHDCGTISFLGAFCGAVALEGEVGYIGARNLSSFSAELSATAWALAWVLQSVVV